MASLQKSAHAWLLLAAMVAAITGAVVGLDVSPEGFSDGSGLPPLAEWYAATPIMGFAVFTTARALHAHLVMAPVGHVYSTPRLRSARARRTRRMRTGRRRRRTRHSSRPP